MSCQEVTEKLQIVLVDFGIIQKMDDSKTGIEEALAAQARIETILANKIGLGERLYDQLMATIHDEQEIGRRIDNLEIGVLTEKQLINKIQQQFPGYHKDHLPGLDLMFEPEFTISTKKQTITTIRLKVSDLGLTGRPTTQDIFTRAAKLGLALCPPEVGPYQRLRYPEQPKEDKGYHIAMKPIKFKGENDYIFSLSNVIHSGVVLDRVNAFMFLKWDIDEEFLFCLPQVGFSSGE